MSHNIEVVVDLLWNLSPYIIIFFDRDYFIECQRFRQVTRVISNSTCYTSRFNNEICINKHRIMITISIGTCTTILTVSSGSRFVGHPNNSNPPLSEARVGFQTTLDRLQNLRTGWIKLPLPRSDRSTRVDHVPLSVCCR